VLQHAKVGHAFVMMCGM